MNPSSIIDIGVQALWTAAQLAAPILITALVVGFAVSVSQIQETSLSFVPKAVAVSIALIICGQWMIAVIVQFTLNLFHEIPTLVGR